MSSPGQNTSPIGLTLTPLPPSPSPSLSSLTSEETSFDHLAPASIRSSPPSTANASTSSRPRTGRDSLAPARTLGLRELVKMRNAERAKVPSHARRPDGPPDYTASTLTATFAATSGQVQILHSPVSERVEEDVITSPTDGPFASQVVIRGWKVVGGKSWNDRGKVGAYVVYDIDISLRNGGTINILRRYTDFVNLRTALKSRFPKLGQAIPPLPGKGHMSKFNPTFLEERQPRLQRFLRGVILHPEMGKGGEGSVVGTWITGQGG